MQTHLAVRRRIFFWAIIFAALWLNIQPVFSTPAGQDHGGLVINEFLALNRTGLADEDGHYADWIEIYNPGRQAVNLAGWSLTDDPDQPEKWTFPTITLGSRKCLVVFASGKNRKPTRSGSELHTNFKLDHTGEFLGLYNIIDRRFVSTPTPVGGKGFPEQFRDIAFGRYADGQSGSGERPAYGYLAAPTPGQPDNVALLWSGLVAPVHFSRERGFYETPFKLELSATTPGAAIRYTIDGSTPTETHGAIYTGPIAIKTTTLLRAAAFKPNFRSSPVETHTYIFLDDVLAQPKDPPGFPRSWGGYQGSLVRADYEMDPEVVDHPRYGGLIEEALRSIPTMSIVTDMQSFHDLYANPRRRGRAWERPASVELINPAGDRPGFQINAGLRIQGESGRLEFMPKHPFRLFFRGQYGAARLEYPLFPDSSVEEFDTLILRSGVNRSYAGLPEFDQSWTAYTRDEWLRASQIAMSGSGAHGIFVHLYLNGLYWGLYNVIERPDASFMSSYFGGVEDDWQVISHEEAISHSSDRFRTLHELAGQGRLDEPEKYAAIKSYLDVPHFIDYLILNWYTGNIDWAFNNWYAGVGTSAGRVKYYVWDGERIWDDGAEIFFDRDEYLNRPNLAGPLIEALLENPDFRLELADRLYKHLFKAGALAEANSQARWLSLNDVVEPAIVAESARWGDVRNETPLTPEDWFKARDDVLAQMDGNAAKLIALAREAGYYPDIDPPLFNRPGGQVAPGFKLTITHPSQPTPDRGGAGGGWGSEAGSAIYYTTDGSDPRLPGTGAIAPQARIYNGPLALTTTTHIKVRALASDPSLLPTVARQAHSVNSGQAWSALNEAVFSLDDEPNGRLQITEIMYNPVGGDEYEFIELKNTGNAALDPANLAFEGIAFTFPPTVAAPLAPGQFIVLVRDPAAFARRYPGLAIDGTYAGQLSNKGETITLKDAQGNVIASLAYDDENGWPLSPDGRGDSLVLVDPKQDPSSPQSWRASADRNGSPGADE